MSLESKLEGKLRKFSLVDFACVKSVYFVCGLLVFSLYPTLAALDWWFYFTLAIFCAFPLWVHMFSQPGKLIEKMHQYIQTNGPSNQVLLFFAQFFFALMLGVLLPILVSFSWWVYVLIIVVLAIKPMTVSWVW